VVPTAVSFLSVVSVWQDVGKLVSLCGGSIGNTERSVLCQAGSVSVLCQFCVGVRSVLFGFPFGPAVDFCCGWVGVYQHGSEGCQDLRGEVGQFRGESGRGRCLRGLSGARRAGVFQGEGLHISRVLCLIRVGSGSVARVAMCGVALSTGRFS
jgi:hypothetical protein